MDHIRGASEEQARGIQQVTATLTQMERITEQTAAGTEQSASAGEELFSQSSALRAMVGRLASMVHGSSHSTATDVSSFGPRSTDPRVVPGKLRSYERGGECPRWSPSAGGTVPTGTAMNGGVAPSEAIGSRTCGLDVRDEV